MKTANEIKQIIRQWWEWNSTMAQLPEGRYFKEQLGDWEAGFQNSVNEGYTPKQTDFVVVSAKDVAEGLSVHIEGSETLKGVLNTKTGEFTQRGDSVEPFRGASIDG
jgi:hypothetical protein